MDPAPTSCRSSVRACSRLALALPGLIAAPANAQSSAAPRTAALRLDIERELVCSGGQSAMLAWSRDGAWIASRGECGDVVIVAAADGAVRHQFTPAGTGGIWFAPDRPVLAVVGDDVVLWSVPDGRRLATWPALDGTPFAWRADGRECVFVDDQGDIVTMDAALQQPTHRRQVQVSRITGLGLHPDGARVAVATPGGRWVYDLTTGARSDGLSAATQMFGTGWLANGRLVTVGEWHLYGLAENGASLPFAAAVSRCDVRADLDTVLVSGPAAATVVHGDGQIEAIAARGPAALGPDGHSVAFADGGRLHFVGGATARGSVPLPHRAPPPPVMLSRDGRWLAGLGPKGPLRLWDVDAGRERTVAAAATGELWARFGDRSFVTLTQARDGAVLHTWSPDLLIVGLPAPIGVMPLPRALHEDPWIVFSPDGRWLAAGAHGYDMIGGRQVWELPAGGGMVSVSNDGLLRLSQFGNQLSLLDADGSPVRTLRLKMPMGMRVRLSSNCSNVLVLTRDGLSVRRASDLEELWSTGGPNTDAAWLDDDTVATLVADGNAIEVLRDGETVARLELPSHAAAFTIADRGARIAVALDDLVVVLHVQSAEQPRRRE